METTENQTVFEVENQVMFEVKKKSKFGSRAALIALYAISFTFILLQLRSLF